MYTNRQVNEFLDGETHLYKYPIYQVLNDDIVMTKELFSELLGNLSVPELSVTGDSYAYSQAVPDGAEIEDVIFVLLFMWPVAITKATETEMSSAVSDALYRILYLFIVLLFLMCIVIYLIVICVTRKIVRSIRVLNRFSIEMKQAYDRQSR